MQRMPEINFSSTAIFKKNHIQKTDGWKIFPIRKFANLVHGMDDVDDITSQDNWVESATPGTVEYMILPCCPSVNRKRSEVFPPIIQERIKNIIPTNN